MNREVPNNIDAEQSLLGSLFLNKKSLQKALEILSGEEFYLDSHQNKNIHVKKFYYRQY